MLMVKLGWVDIVVRVWQNVQCDIKYVIQCKIECEIECKLNVK